MEKLRLRSESGFTLIELLVVVAIIGILAAIAIPQFAAYRRRGFVAQVQSDLRNMAVAEEAYFAQNQSYTATTCDSDPAAIACAPAIVGFNQASLGVNAVVTLVGTTGFTIVGTHAQCADQWTFDSSLGTINRAAAGGPGTVVC
ncbi:MAG: type IV pilin protein, partial [Candidatus Binatia bacterium]